MGTLSTLSMEEFQTIETGKIPTREIPEGYFPARLIAAKYGYSKDYLTRLLRKGHIKGFQRDNALKDWFIEEASLKIHRRKVLQAQKAAPTVLLSVPYNNEGSLNAEPQQSHIDSRQRSQRGQNPALGPTIFLSGIFFLIIFSFFQFDFSINLNPKLKSSLIDPLKLDTQYELASFWNSLRDIFSDTQQIQVIEKIIVRHIYESKSEARNPNTQTTSNTETIREIIREIQSLPSDTLASLNSRIDDLNLKFLTLSSQFNNVPTVISLPSSNTSGIGSITMTPQKVDTETLSVSSSATLSSLDVTNNATISGNFTVSGTTTFNQAITSNKSIEIQGTASSSYGLFSNTIQVGGYASTAYSRFGTSTTSHANYIDTTNDLLISGDLEVKATASFSGTASISGDIVLKSIRYTFPNADGSSGQFLKTNGGGTLSWADAKSSNSLDFDEIVNTMLLDSDLTITPSIYKIGIGSAPSTLFEVQGTASASYLLTGNTLQVGGYSSVAYSRFGTNTTGHSNYISASNDLLVSGDLEVDGSISAQFASSSQMFITNSTASASLSFRGNGSGAANQSIFSIGVGNGTENLSIFNNDKSPFVTIASTGDVGIGMTNPDGNRLVVRGSGTTTGTVFKTQDSTGSAKFVILDNGNVGIGTTGPTSALSFGTNATITRSTSDGSDNGYLELAGGGGPSNQARGGFIQIHGNESSLGTVYIYPGSAGGNFIVANTAAAGVFTVNSTTGNVTIVGSGTTCTIGNGTGATNCTSDARLKENVFDLGSSLEKIRDLRPVTYNWIDKKKEQTTNIGLIAQEVQSLFPSIVHTVYDDYLGIDYANLVVPAIGAIQELDVNIASQSVALEDISFRIEDLEAQIASQSQELSLGGDSINNNLVFTAVTSMFKDVFNIVWEQGMLRVANVVAEKVKSDSVETKQLCLEDFCVTKDQLKSLFTPVIPIVTPTPEATPEATPEPTPELTPEPTPEPTPESTPEVTPDVDNSEN